MIESPWRYEENLTPADFQKIGELLLRCSHIEHVLGNCLKTLLRLTDDEAVIMVFPLSIEQRFQRIKQAAALVDLNNDAQAALDALTATLKHVQTTRNDLAHGIIDDRLDKPSFHRRSNQRTVSKEEAFSSEELINYVAHATLALRYALGFKTHAGARWTLPDRPSLPKHLQT